MCSGHFDHFLDQVWTQTFVCVSIIGCVLNAILTDQIIAVSWLHSACTLQPRMMVLGVLICVMMVGIVAAAREQRGHVISSTVICRK